MYKPAEPQNQRIRPPEAAGLLTHDEMCATWKCDRKTVYKCIAEGMPARKIGSRYFFDLAECQKWYRGE